MSCCLDLAWSNKVLLNDMLTCGCFCCRIEEIENKVGAGLIEEVILMAKSELKLIDILYKAKV